MTPSRPRHSALSRDFQNAVTRSLANYTSPTDPESDSDNDRDHTPTTTVGGLETVIGSAGHSALSVGTGTRASHRAQDALAAKHNVWDGISNKQLPPEDTGLMIKLLEKRADERIRRTYVAGQPLQEVYRDAVVLKVGLIFMPGADKPQVNRLEQTEMNTREPDQKDSLWRVHTAGLLLSDYHVSRDLSVVQRDQTAQIAERARSRLRRWDTGYSAPSRSGRAAVTLNGRAYDAVNIDSAQVHIVNDLRERREEWDLESTLIEVDGSSVMDLMVHYKHLISRGGPDMTFEETKTLLETMIEDARRLCVRSPSLFRMSTRCRIINSKNTRYGVDNGRYFQTLTTSRGIQETISLSASYYNSLDPSGTNDATQRFIRPRFLQMIVLLLSLLNNDDLAAIADFLESTYKVKAERQHLELLFMKVIPLMSINEKVFLRAMVPAYEGYPLKEPMHENLHGFYWDTFIQRILHQGYILPGTIANLGRHELSWIVKWPEEGFNSSIIFRHLQYGNHRFGTFNEIPHIELHLESQLSELTVVMTNDEKYIINSGDLESITCLMQGTYSVREARPGGRHYDLIVEEHVYSDNANEACYFLNEVIRKANYVLTGAKSSNSGGALVRRLTRRKSITALSLLEEVSGPGRLTRNRALLDQDVLATVYKLEGRKITRNDAIHIIEQYNREISAIVRYIKQGIDDLGFRPGSPVYQQLRTELDRVNVQLNLADDIRHQIADSDELSDEPISKVIYPGTGVPGQRGVWNEYKTRFSGGLLYIEAKKFSVGGVSWLDDKYGRSRVSCKRHGMITAHHRLIEVTLSLHPVKYIVSPLQPVEEGFRDDEVQIGDTAVLAGQYIIIATEGEFHQALGYAPKIMTNYLKIVSTEEEHKTRRGMNRNAGRPSNVVETVFA